MIIIYRNSCEPQIEKSFDTVTSFHKNALFYRIAGITTQEQCNEWELKQFQNDVDDGMILSFRIKEK